MSSLSRTVSANNQYRELCALRAVISWPEFFFKKDSGLYTPAQVKLNSFTKKFKS